MSKVLRLVSGNDDPHRSVFLQIRASNCTSEVFLGFNTASYQRFFFGYNIVSDENSEKVIVHLTICSKIPFLLETVARVSNYRRVPN